jgi:hypothetical protein
MTNRPTPASQPKRSRTAELLTKLLAAKQFTVEELAEVLVVDARTIGQYVSGEIDMPLDRQICFARLLVDRVPSFARRGRNLLGQIAASIEYANSQTELHNHGPVSRSHTF